MEEKMSSQMKNCIENCFDCARICQETIVHCLKMGGRHAEAKHILLLMDCSKVCTTAGKLMLHNSDFYSEQCAVCADICDTCADDCEEFEDKFMKKCVKTCRDCADSCRKMSA